MVTQDAETFVALGRAMAVAAEEGALDAPLAHDLRAALAAAILTGSMELDTYAQIHEALARLLEKAFANSSSDREARSSSGAAEAEDTENLGGYLEVVGEAWDRVSGREESNGRVRDFIRSCFDLSQARFGGDCWFEAPLRTSPEELVRRARTAGLLIVAIDPPSPGTGLTARLCPDDGCRDTHCGQVVLGWGERRANLSLATAA